MQDVDLLQGIKLGERVEFERSKENPRNILTLSLKHPIGRKFRLLGFEKLRSLKNI